VRILWIYRVYADANSHITTWRETHRILKVRHDIHYIFACKHDDRCFTKHATLIRKFPVRGLAFVHFLLAGFVAFRRMVRRLRPDLIIFDHFTAPYSLTLTRHRRRPAIVLDLRQAKYSNESAWHAGRLSKAFTKAVLRLNRRTHDGITFISEDLRNQLLADMEMPLHPRHHVWPSGVDPEMFDPIKYSGPARDRTSFDVFFHGSITDGRGLAETVAALPILRSWNVPAVFTIVGDGPYLAHIKQRVLALDVANMVRIEASVPYDQIPRLISKAHVCAMAYPQSDFWEGNVPIKLLEYMAMEKVILTTPIGAFQRVTRGTSCAHVIPDHRPETIARGIADLYARRDELPLMGRVGRTIVSEHYTWRAVSENLEAFLEQVVRLHRAGPADPEGF
jgi:glycosyltransferase involved in cell wall biosynthesis